VEELIEGWRRKGATIGIREYYEVGAWTRPSRWPRGSNLEYLKQSSPVS